MNIGISDLNISYAPSGFFPYLHIKCTNYSKPLTSTDFYIKINP